MKSKSSTWSSIPVSVLHEKTNGHWHLYPNEYKIMNLHIRQSEVMNTINLLPRLSLLENGTLTPSGINTMPVGWYSQLTTILSKQMIYLT